MKAVRGVESSIPGVEVVETDEPLGDGTLVRVRAVSICASDLRYLTYGTTHILGHEISGTTSDGTAVVLDGIASCGTCVWCLDGATNMCDRAARDIIGLTVDGGMAEYVRVPARALIPIPTGLAVEDASLCEPGAVAWHACRKAGVGPETRVLIVGAGTIGLLAVLAARHMGAAEVSLVARHDYQRVLGEQFGATSPTGLYDAVIEASGTESGLSEAVDRARPQGTVATVSVFAPDVVWPYRAAFVKEIAIVPSMGYCHDRGRPEIAHVGEMLAGHTDLVKTLITHRFGIDDAARAFQLARTRPPGTFKIVVQP